MNRNKKIQIWYDFGFRLFKQNQRTNPYQNLFKILSSDVLPENRHVVTLWWLVEKVFAWVTTNPWYHCLIRSPEFTLYDLTGWPRSQERVLWSHYDTSTWNRLFRIVLFSIVQPWYHQMQLSWFDWNIFVKGVQPDFWPNLENLGLFNRWY